MWCIEFRPSYESCQFRRMSVDGHIEFPTLAAAVRAFEQVPVVVQVRFAQFSSADSLSATSRLTWKEARARVAA